MLSLFRQLRSAAGVGGLSWVPPAAGTDAAAHAEYRPDIDGLRAVAVLPVLFYHFGIGLTSGGFVGVDVFFVRLSDHQPDLGRDARGDLLDQELLCPAGAADISSLVLHGAITALFVLLFCLPSDAKRFSSSLAAATLFGSNVYFYLTADYFAAAAETQPLLHTWTACRWRSTTAT
jgi:hypothetical protein